MLKRLLPLLLLFLPAVAQAASAAQGLLYERTLMDAAGRRCGLFAPDVAAALAAAKAQARGAALRAGDSPAAVAATQARALARAGEADCRSAGLRTAAERVRDAFQSYSQLYVMRFPGPRSAWRAERPSGAAKAPPWSLVEALPGSGGWILFGMTDGAPALLDARRGAAPAAFARIVVRDPTRATEPYLGGPPPPALSRVVLASARRPASRALWPAGATGATLYLFPPDLLARLAGLDPRETAGVELVYPSPGRDRVVAASLEIGDLEAAKAFLASARRPAPAR
jgi:hypothetical protein